MRKTCGNGTGVFLKECAQFFQILFLGVIVGLEGCKISFLPGRFQFFGIVFLVDEPAQTGQKGQQKEDDYPDGCPGVPGGCDCGSSGGSGSACASLGRIAFMGIFCIFLTLLLACPLIILGRLRLGFWTLFLLLFCHGTLRHCRVCISGCLAV